MKNKDIHRIIKKVTREIRILNKEIENDPLWKGRFYAEPIRVDYERFDDKSGVLCKYFIVFVDKETKKQALYTNETTGTMINIFSGKMGWAMNDFIVDYINVWENEHPTRESAKDYTKVKKLDKLNKVSEFNFTNIMN